QAAAEEVEAAAREATGRRNQAELLEGGLHPAELTAEEAAMTSEGASAATGAAGLEGPPPFLRGDDVTPDLNDEPLPLQDLDLVEDLDELAGPDEEAQADDFDDDDDGHQPV
ncbi:serine/threonine protein kinase, partial [Corallococcus sp. 4LFB]